VLTTQSSLARIGAVAAIAGSVLLFAATSLHPLRADPNDAPAAFAEYAADLIWVASHLGQFLGVVLLGVALVGLAATVESGRPSAWAQIGRAGTAASVAVAAVLQAVDGVALRAMVLRWAASSGDAQARAFEAAYGVRQIEVGLASLTSLVFGLTMVALGIALVLSSRYTAWLGWMGLAGGAATCAGGVVQAYTGFSGPAMAVSMSASLTLLVWAVLVGVSMWRLAPRLDTGGLVR
jgi:hypothetical protein